MTHMKKEIKILWREARQLTCFGKIPSTTTKLTRGGVKTVEGAPAPRKPATLCPRPKSLRELWAEWVDGIDGRLPACKFTPQQSGDKRVKHSFCQRKAFWKCVERVTLQRGLAAQTVINMMDDLCKGSVTQKLQKIKQDERRGGHHRLHPAVGIGVGRENQ